MNNLMLLDLATALPAHRSVIWQNGFYQLLSREKVIADWTKTPTLPQGAAILKTSQHDAHFTGKLRYGDIGNIRACHLTSRAHRFLREGCGVSGYNNDFGSYIMAIMQLAGTSELHQGSSTSRLHEGHWTFCDPQSPFAIANLEPVEQMLVLLPRTQLGLPQRYDALPVGSHSAGYANLALGLTYRALEQLSSCSVRGESALANSICLLFREAVADLPDMAIKSPTTTKNGVLDYIEQNLRDPHLTIERIAAAMNCSKRTVHNALSEEPYTVAQYILRRRLEQCHEAIVRQESNITLTELAHSWGFSSSSHFSSAFKRQYGCSPTQVRRTSELALC